MIAYEGFPAFDDREPFVVIFPAMGCQPGVLDSHHAANPEVAFIGADEAAGKWRLPINVIILANRTINHMRAEYTDRYGRTDGRWWIAETRSHRAYCRIETVDGEGRATTVAMGDPPAAYGW